MEPSECKKTPHHFSIFDREAAGFRSLSLPTRNQTSGAQGTAYFVTAGRRNFGRSSGSNHVCLNGVSSHCSNFSEANQHITT